MTINRVHLRSPWDTERSNPIDVRAAESNGVLNENTPGSGPIFTDKTAPMVISDGQVGTTDHTSRNIRC